MSTTYRSRFDRAFDAGASYTRLRELADGGAMTDDDLDLTPAERQEKQDGERERAIDELRSTHGEMYEDVTKLASRMVVSVAENPEKSAPETADAAERIECWKLDTVALLDDLFDVERTIAAGEQGRRDAEERLRDENTRKDALVSGAKRPSFAEAVAAMDAPLSGSYDELRSKGRGWDPDAAERPAGGGGEYDRAVAEMGGSRWG
jgi:hypothetical protein